MDRPMLGQDEERRTKKTRRDTDTLSVTSLPGLTNDGPSQRFFLAPYYSFLYCIPKAEHSCRRTTGHDESREGVTIVVYYMNSCRLALCAYVCVKSGSW